MGRLLYVVFDDLFPLIALMMEAGRTSETSVDIYLATWQYIPEDSELQMKGNFMLQ
jgi:hypothetical protein